MITGATVSRLTVVETVVVPPPEIAEHVNVVPAVSAVTVAGGQSNVTAESGSETSHETETSERYQSWVPSVPFTTARTTGAVMSSVAGRQNHAPRKYAGSSGAEEIPKLPLKIGCW